MLPPLGAVEAGLRRTTEAMAAELASPGGATPGWSETDWQLARAAAVIHGVSPLLAGLSTWAQPRWTRFLQSQRRHVEIRHRRIAALLARIDADARAAGIAFVPLKGAALHAQGLYIPGDRPMADIDLLVHESDAGSMGKLLQTVGYVHSFDHWRHRVFKPAHGVPPATLGEHCGTPVNIELHTRIRERLPVVVVDITERIWSRERRAGKNSYSSNGALMSHLLLHAAGNICGRNLRLLHLHDIALLARRMNPDDWELLCDNGDSWWAWPPLRLVSRYYRDAIPDTILTRLECRCPPLLRAVSRHQTLTRVSCSAFWLQTLPGMEWCRSFGEAARCIRDRIKPPAEKLQERADLVRTNFWLQGQTWSTASRKRWLLTRLTRRVPRIDTMYVVRMALEPATSAYRDDLDSTGIVNPADFGKA
ncbi:MAG: nucleotidyltransferase family protein [Rhodanobacteraceae bacterium]